MRKFLLALTLVQVALVVSLFMAVRSADITAQEDRGAYEYFIRVLEEAKERGLWSDSLSEALGDYIVSSMIAPSTGETVSEAKARIQADRDRPVSQRVEIEGYVISVDRSANVLSVNVVEYEYFGGLARQNPMSVDYGRLPSVENWLTTGRYIEVEGQYDPSTNVLTAREVEADDDDGDGDYADYQSGYGPGSTQTTTPALSQSYLVEIEGYVVSVDRSANVMSVNVVEYEYFGGLARQNPMSVDYGRLPSVENWLTTGRYIEVEGRYDPSTNVLTAREVEADDDDGDGDYDDYQSGYEPRPTQTPTPESGQSYRVEIEGYVISVDRSANVMSVNVVEYEYFGGLARQNPMTVDYGRLPSVENWLTTGRYIEVEGRYDPSTNVLTAYEVEAEDSDDGYYNGDDDDDSDDDYYYYDDYDDDDEDEEDDDDDYDDD